MLGPLHRSKPQKLLLRSWRRGDRVRRERGRAFYWKRTADAAIASRERWKRAALQRLEAIWSIRMRWFCSGIGVGLLVWMCLGKVWK